MQGHVASQLQAVEDEIRSVAVGYGEVDLARGPEIARSKTSEGSPEGTAPSPAYCCVVVVSALYSPAES